MSLKRRTLISPRAAADLDEIAEYIARDSPERAASFIAALERTIQAVSDGAQAYPLRPDLAPEMRMAVHGRYLVFFRDLPADGAVRIERVLHGARDLRRLL